MNHRKILTRAWMLLWQNRALWLFGFLFALAGGQAGSRFFNGSGSGGSGGGQSGNPTGPFPNFHMPDIDWTMVAWIGVAIIVAVVILILVGAVVRYVAKTALIAGVDEIESTGAPLTVRRGFRLGWSHQAWSLFMTDLIIRLPLALVSILLIAIAASPLLLWLTHVRALGILATLVAIALLLLVVMSLIVVSLILSVIMPYVERRVVLEKQSALNALRQGAQLVRLTLVDTGLMWLILGALRIVWSLVQIPVVILVLLVAVVVGGIPAGLIYLITQSWVIPAIVGGGLFLLVLVPATAFIEGLFEVYESSAWTLSYREVAGKLVSGPVVPVAPVAPVMPVAEATDGLTPSAA